MTLFLVLIVLYHLFLEVEGLISRVRHGPAPILRAAALGSLRGPWGMWAATLRPRTPTPIIRTGLQHTVHVCGLRAAVSNGEGDPHVNSRV